MRKNEMLERTNVNTFLEDLTYNCAYTFLEEGNKELNKIAKKRGIILPSHDLAVFKCVYAFIGQENLNGCTLPKDEVEKSLQTLVGKAVDFDHFRQKTVGYWIDAEIDGDKLIAYGMFFKSNLADDYITIKDLMEQGKLKISFEAYGVRNYTSITSYTLSDLEFCGGALLITTKPAFKDAGVLEMANKERVLEMANVMIAPETFVHDEEDASYKCSCIKCGHEETSDSHCKDIKCSVCGGQMRRADRPGSGQGDTEVARLYVEDMEVIKRLLMEIEECPACGGTYPYLSILNIDFENDVLKVEHSRCESVIKINLEPTTTILKKGKRIKDVKLEDKSTVDEIKQENSEKIEGEIIDMEESKQALVDTIKDSSEMRKVKCVDCGYVFDSDVLAKSTQCPKCGGRCDLVSDIAKEDKKEEQSEVKDEIKEEKVETKEEEKVEDKKVDEKADEKVEEVIEEKAEEKKEEKVEEVKKEEKAEEKVEEVKEEKVVKVEEVKEEAKENVDDEVAEIKAELATVTKERDEYKATLDKIEEAKKAETIKSRRDELGEEVAKDISDVDILDDKTFKILKLEKENKELKEGKVESSSLEVGSSEIDNETPDWKARQAKVNELAYGKESKEE